MNRIQAVMIKLASKYRNGYYEEGYDLQAELMDLFMNALKNQTLDRVLADESIRDFELLMSEFLRAIDRNDFVRAADLLEFKFTFRSKLSEG